MAIPANGDRRDCPYLFEERAIAARFGKALCTSTRVAATAAFTCAIPPRYPCRPHAAGTNPLQSLQFHFHHVLVCDAGHMLDVDELRFDA